MCVPVTVRCWPGRVHRSIASFTPVRAEWPCQPRVTSKMFRLEATRCSSQVGVSKRMKVFVLSLVHTNQTEWLFFQQTKKHLITNLFLFFCQQVSEGNVCWTHLPRYYSVICDWTQGRARPVCVYLCLLGNTNVLQFTQRHCTATCSQTHTVRLSQATARPVSAVSR